MTLRAFPMVNPLRRNSPTGKLRNALDRGGLPRWRRTWIAITALAALVLAPLAVEAHGDPTAPGNLTVEIVAGQGVELNWEAPAEDAESVTGYQILRRLPLQGEPRPTVYVADTGSTATTYTDSEATVADEQYNYRVKALRGNQKSGLSNLAKVTFHAFGPAQQLILPDHMHEHLHEDNIGSCDLEDPDHVENRDDIGVLDSLLLPDLVSCQHDYSVAEVVVAPDGTELHVLRFAGFVTNLGDGPLDLKGNPQLADDADLTSHDVWQRALTVDGDWVNLTKPPIKFEQVDGHGHFHLMGIVEYSLWDKSRTVEVRSGAKVGFCLLDIAERPDLHPNPGPEQYKLSDPDIRFCKSGRPRAKNLRMGISKGWQDIYSFSAPFQWIDVSNVRPGYYRVGQRADPDNVIVESDETNNGLALSQRLHVVPGYVAMPETVRVEPDATVRFKLSADEYFDDTNVEDGSPRTRVHRIVTQPSHGSLDVGDTVTVIVDGTTHQVFTDEWVTYTPDPGYAGADSFTFVALDESLPKYPINPVVAKVTLDISVQAATITELTLTDANGASIALTPTFEPLVDTYEASVPNGVTSIGVAATKNHSDAELEFIDRVDAIQTGDTSEVEYDLDVGDNLIEVEVTSASGNEVKTYTVNVTRAGSDDATLSSLELRDSDGAAIELTPAFDPAVTEYSVSVPNGVESVTLTTEESHGGAAAAVLTPSGVSEPDEATVDLAVGSNLLGVVVSAEDGKAVVTYTVSVERAEPEWSASLTVGTDETTVPVATGYSKWSITGAELSTDELTFAGETYRVKFLFNLAEGLYFTLARELPSDFTLRIGGSEYAGRDSSIGHSIWEGNYWWGNRGFSWTPGETVEVSLSMNLAPLPAREDAPPSAYFTYMPSGHNGADSFQFRLNFTQPVEITDVNLRDHALVVDGGSVSKVKDLGDRRWLVIVEPDSSDDVTVSLYEAANCQELGAICSSGGASLYNYPVLTVLVAGASAVSAQGAVPDAPDLPIGTAVFVGGVDLEWNEVPLADSYDVQLYQNGRWIDLPGGGVEIAFYGAGAIISGLDPSLTLWFQVRARNAHGSSDWSDFDSMPSTNQFALGRRARPANEAASGAPVINGTAQVGEILTADTTEIEDGNGLDRVQFRFQWATNDGSADTDIAGATNSTYILAASDEGKIIKVRVAFTDRGGYVESLISDATETVSLP